MRDTDDELLEIKREIVESRSLVIKTNNLTNSLAADIKAISKRQLAYEQRTFWNSAGANLVFFVVVLGVVKVAWDARVESVEEETRGAKERATKVEAEMKVLGTKEDERSKAESAAAAYYELVRTGRQQEVVDGYEAIRKEPLTRAEQALFSDAVERARTELSLRSYQMGLDHVRMGRWHEAVTAFEESVALRETAAHVPMARLSLARAYRKLGRPRDAVGLLVGLAEASPDKELLDDAGLLLAQCYVELAAYNEAKTTLRAFIRRFPDSPLVGDARSLLAEIGMKH
jgi:TolA-binding protein